MNEIAGVVLEELLYGNFDIMLGHFPRVSQLRSTPHAPCDMLCLIHMLAVS